MKLQEAKERGWTIKGYTTGQKMLHHQADRGCCRTSWEGRQGAKKGKKKKKEAKESHKRDYSEKAETILIKKMSALLKSNTFNTMSV